MSRGIRSPERLSHPCLCVDGQPRSFAHLARARRVAGPPDESAGATLCPVRESPESPQRQFMGRPLPFLPDSGRCLAADLPTLYRTEPGARRHGGASWGIPLVELSRQYRRRSLPAHHPASALRNPGNRRSYPSNRLPPTFSGNAGSGLAERESTRQQRQFRNGQCTLCGGDRRCAKSPRHPRQAKTTAQDTARTFRRFV